MMLGLQSAMEYLMTYGWAILAIAIVMVSLYSLGIFNTGNLQPTATPGSCEVVRTVAQVSLAGQCSNLIPKYVINTSTGGYVKFNNPMHFPIGAAPFSVFAWIKTADANRVQIFSYGPCNTGQLVFFSLSGSASSQLQIDFCNDAAQSGPNLLDGKWHFVGVEFAGVTTNVNFTVDGAAYASTLSSIPNIANDSYSNVNQNDGIGGAYSPNYAPFVGQIADVQLYNASLDSASAKALYLEGIGGAPIDIRHLVGWWPLNGNANDYSGNNGQGTLVGPAVWNANWQSGYSLPSS